MSFVCNKYDIGGQLCIFPIDCKGIWRKDYHNYITRKNSVTAVREDQVKLKLNGIDFATCSYCKGNGLLSAHS
jgi:hypothetical protein